MESYDVGSMPFVGDLKKFAEGALHLTSKSDKATSASTEYFETKIIDGLLDKLRTGINIPNYPQFRDMNTMFFEMLNGIEKMSGGYVEIEKPSLKSGRSSIPEVLAISKNSEEIYKKLGAPFKFKICITGPYTLSSLFAYKDPLLYQRLSDVLNDIVDGNIFKDKYGEVRILTVDEPLFGMIDDSTIDVGSDGREKLLQAWEKIFHKGLEKGVDTCIHLHSSTDELFWEIESLKIIETHEGDPLYSSRRTKKLLESNEKVLKASICGTNFDKIIERYLISKKQNLSSQDVAQKIGDVWKTIKSGIFDPNTLLEKAETMTKKLENTIKIFGSERIPYAGPECGLMGFPTYDCALECLKRIRRATEIVNSRNP